MKIGDIYKSKASDSIIQIDSFATHMENHEKMVIVYSHIQPMMGGYGSCPSFNSYGTSEEIEGKYALLVLQEDLDKYETWEDIFSLIKN